MKRSIRGSYTVEATIFLPLVILAVLSLGYVMKTDGAWESCVSDALDESSRIASREYDGGAPVRMARLKKRLSENNNGMESINITGMMYRYSDGKDDGLISYTVEANSKLDLPAGFTRTFDFKCRIKYRGFVGRKEGSPMGRSQLETEKSGEPVMIFPNSGEKYHSNSCRYVKALAKKKILNQSIKARYQGCSVCGSSDMKNGSIVFCFESEGSAYHRGSCRILERNAITMDKSEAIKKGYNACSKCGG